MVEQSKNGGAFQTLFRGRRSGILLPVSSLLPDSPGETLAGNCERFIRFQEEAGFGLWQMLPVHPTDEYGSPYHSVSVHAGDPGMIDSGGDANENRGSGKRLLQDCLRFSHNAGPEQQDAFNCFRRDMAYWLEDFALYTTIKHLQGGRPWWQWPRELRTRESAALREWRQEYRQDIEYYCFEQFQFFSQWRNLRERAAAADILLLGDMPLYPAHDSADVWANQHLFKLDDNGRPLYVAGVPPDYFSSTGQRWGNPVYDWNVSAQSGYRWWLDRVQTQLALFDLIRLDHFRGLEAAWEIPAEAETAEHGQWRPVPGSELLKTMHQSFGGLPFIAEDLGTITPEVVALRHRFRLPGMKVLQFAFDGDAANPYLPHNHEPDNVIYTGTHDNNTTTGWFEALDEEQKAAVMDYLGYPDEPMPWPLIRTALASICRFAVLPMQDLLGLGAEHRLNTPGTRTGNWQWRLSWPTVPEGLTKRLRQLNELYGRC